ncbi:transcobalamin-2 [Tachyglossus aculeatus]|uniref:transcobalamin-2 n=1 Tax=Tachyglossus aculeatus TaxID=9261 RepID=UPI0018F7446E|nr:transcobalamin-2 [Tachyglossus aculeatus]
MGCWGLLLALLGCLGVSGQLCEIKIHDRHLVDLAERQLLTWLDSHSPAQLNPSIYVGLLLSEPHHRHAGKEAVYLEKLMVHYQWRSSFGADGQKPNMGQLALYFLALRAGCVTISKNKGNTLVTQLKGHLEEAQQQIGYTPRPHVPKSCFRTNYYQYSLGVLALCVHGKVVPDHVVEQLLREVEHCQHSVDTVAMMGLAFICLKGANLNPNLDPKIEDATQQVVTKILQTQTPEGHFGNLYSSPLALQVLMAAEVKDEESACERAGMALVRSLRDGDFQNPVTLSQLLPVLHHKTYLDLIPFDCSKEKVTVKVHLKIKNDLREPKMTASGHRHSFTITVPSGAFLVDVLKKAEELGKLTYETQHTLSGPFLTTVEGVKAEDHEYWQLLRASGPDQNQGVTPLLQGVADYRLKDEEVIILQLSKW